jgi:serine-type D-Ala-D-Ala carboxypeptidase/endopeptidase
MFEPTQRTKGSKMRRIALALTLGLAATATIAAGATPATLDGAFRDLGQQFVAAGHTDGLSIAVVDHGKVTYYNFGTTSREHPARPTEDTLYEIGSVTKVFTSLLLAHAVVDSKARVDDDLRQYLPGEYPNLAFEGAPVRLRDLASTTSGLPDNLPDFRTLMKDAPPARMPWVVRDALVAYGRPQLLADLHQVTLAAKPGTVQKHSNLGAVLLGVSVEKIFASDFDTLRRRYIEQPFSMASGHDASRDAHMATGYDDDHVAMPDIEGDYIRIAGGLRYSTKDMAKFIRAELEAKDPAIRLTQMPMWTGSDGQAIGYN